MAKKSIIESIANASDSVRNIKDSFYVGANKIQKKAVEAQSEFRKAKSGNKIDEDMERENAKTRAKAMERLQKTEEKEALNGEIKIDGEVVEVGGPIQIDNSRKNFDQVGEFNDVKMKEGIKLGDEIEDWLKGIFGLSKQDEIDDEYQQYLAQKNGKTVQDKEQKVDVKRMRKKVEMAKLLHESFDTSGSFDNKTKLYNQISGLSVSEDNLTRTTNLSYIFQAYSGDLNAKNIVNEIKNNETEQRMSAAIRECLDGEISEEMMTQKLFAEIHGIDNNKLKDTLYSDEALVQLAAIQELSPGADISEITSNSESELKTIKDAVLTGKSFNDKNFLAEMGVQNNINKVLETGDICITPLSVNGRSDGYICYDMNMQTDNVDIMMYSIKQNDSVELGSANATGMVTGSIEAITDVITSHDIGKVKDSGLGAELAKKRELTHIEALQNQMTPEQKLAYQREEEAAVAAVTANYKRNFASGV